MKIGDIGEFGLISRIAALFGGLTPEGWQGIGDDCAIIPMGDDRSMVVTTDMLVEDIHFMRSAISPSDLGYKSLAVNVSDVSAMGATPVASLLSLALPSDIDVEWCDRFFEGYHSLGVPLLGGDTTSSPKGVVINVTAIGICDNAHLKRRSDAVAGDIIVVTSALGDSAGGLRALLSGSARDSGSVPCDACAPSGAAADLRQLVDIHHRPAPFVEQGQWLGRESGVHAMMDISDGVASDLRHILRASGVSARVDLAQIPTSDLLRRVCDAQGWDALQIAVEGGEDYALLCTIAASEFEDIDRRYRTKFAGMQLYAIGVIGNDATDHSAHIEWIGGRGDFAGFRHF